MANAGAAFGLEDVPDLPEAPTEQPKYNRDYHRLFVKFMSWLHKRTYTKAARFQPSALAGIQPHHVADYLKWRAYGTTDVDFKDLEQNPTCRSSTLEQDKKAISFYMPIKGATWNGTSGNPTKSDPVNEVVKEVKKAETQHRGKKSCATRDLTETEYRKVVHELYGKGSFESTIRTACMLKQQVHLITRTDDISKLKYSDYKPHPDFPFALSCKNISEERQCPDQIILGSMDTDFCAMLGLASFNYGMAPLVGKMHSLYSESDPKLAPSNSSHDHAIAAAHLVLSCSLASFWACGSLLQNSYGEYWQTMGATRSLVWTGCAYISPEQPWIDARVAEKLCMGAPIAYKLHPDARRVTPDGVLRRCQRHFTSLGSASSVCLDESWEERMEPPVRAYEASDIPVGVNPVVKVPLSIWTHTQPSGGGAGRLGTTGQASTRQVANQSRQVTAMQTQQQVRTNEEILTRIIAQHNQLQQLIAQEGRTRDSSAAALRGWLETWLGAELTKLNGNICRIAVQPPRMATPDQVDGLTVERTRRNGQTSLRYRQAVATTPADSRPAKLAKYRTVGSAWQEWMHGIGGNKPAKNFTADDISYSRRKPLWTLMATLVNAQKAPAWVISKIEEHYKGSVLNITAAIKQDTIMGTLHEDLCIVRAQ
ncbi:unknown protein [Seminavis robusta]|uniref:Uncharacterized protein n=1 Tax=Seminavis robusta TaxID=568900 RepID=A0A9N8DD02_9STRA|nr:unknown protein [Seminavis robusta]